MSDQGPDLSVVVVNWNGGRALLECVRSAYEAVKPRSSASFPTPEIWLVDNASTDGSAQRAAESLSGLRLVGNASNLGFAKAANQALSQAEGEFVLLLNPDAQISRAALEAMIAVMEQDRRIGIAGCPSVDRAGRVAPGYELSFPGRRAQPVEQSDGPGRDVAWVSGACLLARRAMIDQVGLLDEGFFMYGEDVDWCYRARQAGWRVVTVPEVTIRHDLGGSAALVPEAETARRAAVSRLRFFRKHYPPGRARWLGLGMLTSALLGVGWRLLPSVVRSPLRAAMGREAARVRAIAQDWLAGDRSFAKGRSDEPV